MQAEALTSHGTGVDFPDSEGAQESEDGIPATREDMVREGIMFRQEHHTML